MKKELSDRALGIAFGVLSLIVSATGVVDWHHSCKFAWAGLFLSLAGLGPILVFKSKGPTIGLLVGVVTGIFLVAVMVATGTDFCR